MDVFGLLCGCLGIGILCKLQVSGPKCAENIGICNYVTSACELMFEG